MSAHKNAAGVASKATTTLKIESQAGSDHSWVRLLEGGPPDEINCKGPLPHSIKSEAPDARPKTMAQSSHAFPACLEGRRDWCCVCRIEEKNARAPNV